MPYGGGMGGYGAQGSLGGFLKGVAKVATGFVTGGPLGAAVGLASALTGKGASASVGGSTVSTGLPALPGVSPLTLASRGATSAGPKMTAAGHPSGYHFAKDGSGRLVRNRRRNFANGRALNRAISRVSGFERMVKRNRKALRGLARL
jgi:hypothetical protein